MITSPETSISPRRLSDVDSRFPSVIHPDPRVGAGRNLLFGGLGLILLAGCFLIGGLVLIRPDFVHPGLAPDFHTPVILVYLAVLFFIALLCLLGGFVLIYHGVKCLLRVVNDATQESL